MNKLKFQVTSILISTSTDGRSLFFQLRLLSNFQVETIDSFGRWPKVSMATCLHSSQAQAPLTPPLLILQRKWLHHPLFYKLAPCNMSIKKCIQDFSTFPLLFLFFSRSYPNHREQEVRRGSQVKCM